MSSQQYLNDLQQRIESLTADLPVEVLLLRRQKSSRQASVEPQTTETLNEFNAAEVFDKRLDEVNFDGIKQQQQLGRIKDSFAQVVANSEQQLADKQGLHS